MCSNLFSSPKPKVEKVAPAPQAVSQTDTAAINDTAEADARKKRQRAANGYAGTRLVDRAVLTDNAQGKQQLGD